MMNTPIHTPGAFSGGSGVFPSSAPAPTYPWMCLPIDQDSLAFGTGPETETAGGSGDKKPAVVEAPSTLTLPPPAAPVAKPMLQLVLSDPTEIPSGPDAGDAAAAAEAETNDEKSSQNSKEYLFPKPVKKLASYTDEDDEGCSSTDEEGNYHDQVGYYYAPPRNRREPQTAGGTDRSLSAITNCPISINWLKANFEYAPGKSLPRGFVYDQYVVLCEEHTLEPVNAASFGKLIRCVFPGLKTRRLGTRGNSKYHYNGVYLKTDSVLHALLNHVKTQQGLTYDATGKRGRKMKGPKTWHAAGQPKQKIERIIEPRELTPEEYLGQMPNMDRAFVEINLDSNVELLSGVTPEDLSTFQFIYHEHCKVLVSCFCTVDLKRVKREWKKFWRVRTKKTGFKSEKKEVDPSKISYKAVMSKATLFKICTLEAARTYIRTMDLWTYQLILDVLFQCTPDVMPYDMLNSLESFFGSCLEFHGRCLNGYPATLGKTKSQTLLTLIVSWSESIALNRMVKTVATSLRHEDSLKAMRSELGRALNFNKLELDLSRVLAPNGFALVVKCILDFKKRLDDTKDQTIGAWLSWMESLVQKLQAESERQVEDQERLTKPNPIKFWKMASDKILGAVMRGTAVSSGVFRTLLIFCDTYIASVLATYSARMMGYHLQTFYTHDKQFPEPVSKAHAHDAKKPNETQKPADFPMLTLSEPRELSLPASPNSQENLPKVGDPTTPSADNNEESKPEKSDSQNSETKCSETEATSPPMTKEEEEFIIEVEKVDKESKNEETEILGLPRECDEIITSADINDNEIIIHEVAQKVEPDVTESRFPSAEELGLTGAPDEDRRVVVTLGVHDTEGTQEIVLDFDMLFDPVTAEFLLDHGASKSSVRRAR